MDEKRLNAYRHLLYMALVDIRNGADHRIARSLNPVRVWRRYHQHRLAGALADWLHNLAGFAAGDFEGFDEPRFWSHLGYLEERFPKEGFERYRSAFEQALAGVPGGASYWPERSNPALQPPPPSRRG